MARLCTVLDLLEWFPRNVARNFHVNLLNPEIVSLELATFVADLEDSRKGITCEIYGDTIGRLCRRVVAIAGWWLRGLRTWRGP